MQQLSPEKYIITRARTLPIHKCLVNEGWEVSKMAQVIVMRRHVTGNVTVGIYLVDLLCLGVKDSHYFFNILPSEFEEKIGDGPDFIEISYELAHNIVYAGHDFAMEFTIKPCAEFAVTQYILEEDNDNIPLIEVGTGDEEGRPHLMVQSGSNYHDALSKLRQHAGEGNYNYTIAIGNEDEADDWDGEADDELTLDDFELGTIDAMDARDLDMETLMDVAAIEKRKPNEILALNIEARLRFLETVEESTTIISNEALVDLPMFELIEQSKDGLHTANGFLLWSALDKDNYLAKKAQQLMTMDMDAMTAAYNELPANDQQKPILAIFMYETLIISPQHLKETKQSFIVEILGHHAANCPLAALYLAFDANHRALEHEQPMGECAMSDSITSYLPHYTYFGNYELHVYWLIKVLRYMAEDDLEKAAQFYKLAVEVQPFSQALFAVQFLFSLYIGNKVAIHLEKTATTRVTLP